MIPHWYLFARKIAAYLLATIVALSSLYDNACLQVVYRLTKENLRLLARIMPACLLLILHRWEERADSFSAILLKNAILTQFGAVYHGWRYLCPNSAPAAEFLSLRFFIVG